MNTNAKKNFLSFYSLSFFLLSLDLRQTVPLFLSHSLFLFSLNGNHSLSHSSWRSNLDWRRGDPRKRSNPRQRPTMQSKTVTHHDGVPSSQILNHLSLLISLLLKDLVFFFFFIILFAVLKFKICWRILMVLVLVVVVICGG